MVSLDGYYAGLYSDAMTKKVLLIVCVLLGGLLSMGAAPSIKAYSEQIQVLPNGSGKVIAQVEVTEAAGTIEVPLTTWKGIQNFKVEGLPATAQIQPVLKGDNPHLNIMLPKGNVANLKFRMNFELEPGKVPAPGTTYRNMSYRFLNGSYLPIAWYKLDVLVPEGEVIHSVPSYAPKGKGGVGAQVTYHKVGSNQAVSIETRNLKFGDTVSMTVKAEKEQKTLLWVAVGIILGVGYMYAFRDLVRKPADTPRIQA